MNLMCAFAWFLCLPSIQSIYHPSQSPSKRHVLLQPSLALLAIRVPWFLCLAMGPCTLGYGQPQVPLVKQMSCPREFHHHHLAASSVPASLFQVCFSLLNPWLLYWWWPSGGSNAALNGCRGFQEESVIWPLPCMQPTTTTISFNIFFPVPQICRKYVVKVPKMSIMSFPVHFKEYLRG